MSEHWYYAKDDRQHGPVPRDELAALYRSGGLRGGELVWTEGMPEWQPAARVLGEWSEPAAAAPAAPTHAAVVAPLSAPVAAPAQRPPGGTLSYSMPQMEALVVTPRAMEMLRQTRPWVRLISVLIWVAAGFMILGGIVGLISAAAAIGQGGARAMGRSVGFMVVYIPVALLYIMPAIYLGRYASRLGDLMRLRHGDVLEKALEAQKSFWKFLGMVFIVVLVFYVALIAIFAVMAVTR